MPFEVFLPVFRALILKIGTGQIIVSNIAALLTSVILIVIFFVKVALKG